MHQLGSVRNILEARSARHLVISREDCVEVTADQPRQIQFIIAAPELLPEGCLEQMGIRTINIGTNPTKIGPTTMKFNCHIKRSEEEKISMK